MLLKEEYISPMITSRRVAIVVMDANSPANDSTGDDIGQSGGDPGDSGDQPLFGGSKSDFGDGGFSGSSWE